MHPRPTTSGPAHAADLLVSSLEDLGAEVERIVVRDLSVRACTGCFGCWTKTPGQCVIDDDARSIAERVVASDVYAIVSPVSFGSLGSLAKSVNDRLICLVLPHFTMIDGEVHHRPRYDRYPKLLALGTMSRPQRRAGRPVPASDRAQRSEPAQPRARRRDGRRCRVARRAVRRLLAAAGHQSGGGRMSERENPRALLLVGSPKPKGGASGVMAAEVASRLEAQGWETRTERLVPAFRQPRRALRSCSRRSPQADLVVLSFPVYVDSLPAPVLGFLESWRDAASADLLAGTRQPRFAAIAQCGFPEARHCDVAIEVCRLFAQEIGAEWAGHLAFGMGPSVGGGSIERSPLARVLPEFDAAVRALAEGEQIPAESTAAFARPLAPRVDVPAARRFQLASPGTKARVQRTSAAEAVRAIALARVRRRSSSG